MGEFRGRIFLVDPHSRLQPIQEVLGSGEEIEVFREIPDPSTLQMNQEGGLSNFLIAGEGLDAGELKSLLEKLDEQDPTLLFFLALMNVDTLEAPDWGELGNRSEGVLILTQSNAELKEALGEFLDPGQLDESDELDETIALLENYQPKPEQDEDSSLESLIADMEGGEFQLKKEDSSQEQRGDDPDSFSQGDSHEERVSSGDEMEQGEKKKGPVQEPEALLESLLAEMDTVQSTFAGLEISSEIVGDVGVETVKQRREREEKEGPGKKKGGTIKGISGFDEDFMDEDPLDSRMEKMDDGSLGDEDIMDLPEDFGDELGKKKDKKAPDSKLAKEVYPRKRRPNEPYLKIIISPSLLEARMVLYPHESDPHQADEVKAELERQGVVYGIDSAKIDKFLRQVNERREPVLGEVIAKGKPPVDGNDARVDFEFELDSVLYLEEDDEGRIDYRDMYKIDCVEGGDLLATVHPPTEAEDGISVLGEPVAGRVGKESRVLAARNVRYDEKEKKFYAEVSGQPCLKGIKLTILPVYMVPHDVDYSTGNIDFLGTIVVNGNVTSGFRVRASEDVRVMGVVEGAEIHAGGEVFVKRGFMGGGKGKIMAKKRVIMRHASAAIIFSESDLLVEDSLLNCDVTCKGKVRVVKGKGSIIGGTIRGAGGVECIHLGTEIGTHTRAIVGEHFLVRRMLNGVNQKLNANRAMISKTQDGINSFSDSLGEGNLMGPDQMESLKELKEKLKVLQDEMKDLQKQKDELLKEFKKKCLSRILVRTFAYPGVRVFTGSANMKLVDKAAHCSFYEDPDRVCVKLGPFERKEIKKKN